MFVRTSKPLKRSFKGKTAYPKNATLWALLFVAYTQQGDKVRAEESMKKAKTLGMSVKEWMR